MNTDIFSAELRPFLDVFSRPTDSLESLNYKMIERIGAGRFGEVFKCLKRETNEIVAVKIIPISEKDELDGIPSSIIREASVLRELDHVNIVRLLDVLHRGHEVFLVFEYLELDLLKFMKGSNTPMQPMLIKNFLHQILSGVAHCHSHKILQRDLKPQNLLVDVTNKVVKLADFGCARAFGSVPLPSYTSDVGSEWYKAPELLLGFDIHSTAADVWSVGCIFGEMVDGNPLFADESGVNVLPKIFRLLGTPTEETWPGLGSFLGAPTSPGSSPFKIDGTSAKPKDLEQKFPGLEPAGLDLLSKMLCLYPNDRISAEDALEHSYFDDLKKDE